MHTTIYTRVALDPKFTFWLKHKLKQIPPRFYSLQLNDFMFPCQSESEFYLDRRRKSDSFTRRRKNVTSEMNQDQNSTQPNLPNHGKAYEFPLNPAGTSPLRPQGYGKSTADLLADSEICQMIYHQKLEKIGCATLR